MNLLDKYIIKKFFKTFVYIIVILSILIIVIDFTEKANKFLDLPLAFVFTEYYLNFIPFVINRISPLIVFISSILVTVSMSRHMEITAMLSNGVSFFRFLRPFLFCGMLLSVVIFVMIGWIIPLAAKIKVPFEVKYINPEFYFEGNHLHFKINDSIYIYLHNYDNKKAIGRLFTMEKIIDGNLIEKLSSEKIIWDKKKEKWHIDNYTLHQFKENNEVLQKKTAIDTHISLYPNDFESKFNYQDMLTINELTEFIEDYKEKNIVPIQRYQHEKYERFIYPFSIIMLIIMGTLVSIKKTKRGSSIKIVIGFLLSFIFIIFSLLMGSISNLNLMPPIITALLPTSTFFLLTLIMFFWVKN